MATERFRKSPTGVLHTIDQINLSGVLGLDLAWEALTVLALRSTVINNAMGILTELYEATVKPDEHGALTLHYAAKACILEMVEMLFDRSSIAHFSMNSQCYQQP